SFSTRECRTKNRLVEIDKWIHSFRTDVSHRDPVSWRSRVPSVQAGKGCWHHEYGNSGPGNGPATQSDCAVRGPATAHEGLLQKGRASGSAAGPLSESRRKNTAHGAASTESRNRDGG